MRADARAFWLVNAAQQQRFAALGEIVPLANGIGPGLPVRLVLMREMITAPTGHYVISGRGGFSPERERQVRFYWNPRLPALRRSCARSLRAPNAGVSRRGEGSGDPPGDARTDAGALDLNDEDAEASRYDAIAATYHVLRGSLRPSVPLFTLEIGSGLAFAESPPTRDSFGMHRCSLVAEGLLWAEQRGAKDAAARLAVLRERLTAYGLDPGRIERNPISRYPYRLDTLLEERAA